MNSRYDTYNKSYEVIIYTHNNSYAPFLNWLSTLDNFVKSRINLRIKKFEKGIFGDIKTVSKNVYEARFFFGSGYRVYFSILPQSVIVLLCGGNKDTQVKDIKLAEKYLKKYSEE